MLENENYTNEAIREVPLAVLADEYIKVYRLGDEVSRKGGDAYAVGDMSLAFAYASEAGVYRMKVNLIMAEVERRDAEDGPMTDQELSEMTDKLLGVLGF